MSLKKPILLRTLVASFFLLILSFNLYAQVSERIISYDFTLQLYDTISGVPYDSTLAEDFLSGDNRGNSIVQLPGQPVFPLALNPVYSERFPAADSFNVDLEVIRCQVEFKQTLTIK